MSWDFWEGVYGNLICNERETKGKRDEEVQRKFDVRIKQNKCNGLRWNKKSTLYRDRQHRPHSCNIFIFESREVVMSSTFDTIRIKILLKFIFSWNWCMIDADLISINSTI